MHTLDVAGQSQSDERTWRSGNFTMGPDEIDEELGRANFLQLYTQVQNDANNSIIPPLQHTFSVPTIQNAPFLQHSV